MLKKILYVDMDNVLVDFASGIAQFDSSVAQEYADSRLGYRSAVLAAKYITRSELPHA